MTNNPLIELTFLDTSKNKIENINAIFLRSSMGLSSLIDIIKNQDNVDLIIHMTRHDPPAMWENRIPLFKEHYGEVFVWGKKFKEYLDGNRSQSIKQSSEDSKPFVFIVMKRRKKYKH